MAKHVSANHFDEPKKLRKMSEDIMFQPSKTLGHVIRCDRNDLVRQMTIDSSLQMPKVFTGRVEPPHVGWVNENCKWIYEKEHPEERFDQNSNI